VFTIPDLYLALFEAYGPQHWWPGDTRDEIVIGALLTQNTAWTNVERAIAGLKAAGLCTLAALRCAAAAQVAQLIRPSGYYNQKAPRLIGLAGALDDLEATDDIAARAHLLSQKGVGPETADSILLYAYNRPIFVIDAYTRRNGSRLALRPATDDYPGWQRLFTQALPQDARLFNEYHALLVRHAKQHCRKRPLCKGCVLSGDCPREGL